MNLRRLFSLGGVNGQQLHHRGASARYAGRGRFYEVNKLKKWRAVGCLRTCGFSGHHRGVNLTQT
jgi:hypothetical protein